MFRRFPRASSNSCCRSSLVAMKTAATTPVAVSAPALSSNKRERRFCAFSQAHMRQMPACSERGIPSATV
jgi:hypothetical protein